ncbi:MAG: hypothetical protein B7733_07360 [Myxococcales bacterium FL481]|nr:MAG: hypothetical protein B7733_07360 [Myxococcales bacterium FL481]
MEVGNVLRDSGVSVVELRASIVIGAGSLSFELVRSLVDKLPVMLVPRWVLTPAQPISIEDLVSYLIEAASVELPPGAIVDVGSEDQVSYLDLMREYARQRGLRRWFVPVPLLSPRVSGWWLELLTPLYSHVGRHLVESLRTPTVVRDRAPAARFSTRPCRVSKAIAVTLAADRRRDGRTDPGLCLPIERVDPC